MNDTPNQAQPTDTVNADQVRPVKKTVTPQADVPDSINDSDKTSQVEELEAALAQAKDSFLRSQADYQNLQRRTQEDRLKSIKLATKDLVTDLVQPLDHLSLAAKQLNDPGLNMTIQQLWQTLKEHGLSEIEPVGQEFNVKLMEAVDHKGEGQTVLSVVNRGYVLNGEVIRHAKVVVGDPNAEPSNTNK